MGDNLQIFGEPMKRGSLRCTNCNTVCGERDNSCPKCGCITRAIQIKWKGSKKPYRFTRDKNDKPLYHPEALLTLREINHKADKGKFDPKNYLTQNIKQSLFENEIEKWFKEKEGELEKNDFAPGTYHPYKSYAKNYFIPFFKGMSVREIGEDDIKRFHNSLPKERASHYRLNIYRALKTFFQWLYECGEIPEPAKFKKPPKSVRRQLKPLPFQDQQDALDRIPTEHQDIFRFCSEAALRIGEACALHAGDIQPKRGKAVIRWAYSRYQLRDITKGRETREATLSDLALEIAQRNMKDKLPAAFLFTWGAGHGYKPAYMRKLWRKYSGVPNTCEESMRHSTLTDLADLGASAYDIQDIAGHKDIRTSQHYVKTSAGRLRDVINRRSSRGRAGVGGQNED